MYSSNFIIKMINYFEQSVLQIITVLYLNFTYIQAKKKKNKERNKAKDKLVYKT